MSYQIGFYLMGVAWIVAIVCLIVEQRRRKALRKQLEPGKVLYQLNRGAVILPTDRPGPPREYTVHIEYRDRWPSADEFWVWS